MDLLENDKNLLTGIGACVDKYVTFPRQFHPTYFTYSGHKDFARLGGANPL